MKDYLPSIALFGLVIFLLAKLAMGQVQKVNGLRDKLATAQTNVQMAQNTQTLKRLTLNAKIGSDDVQTFIRRHGGTLGNMRDATSIASVVSGEADRLQLPISDQRPGTRKLAADGASTVGQVDANEFTISVVGNFRDVLTWMGKMEDTFPFARTESVEFGPADSSVSLRTIMVFPQVNIGVLESAANLPTL